MGEQEGEGRVGGHRPPIALPSPPRAPDAAKLRDLRCLWPWPEFSWRRLRLVGPRLAGARME
jgi:hypothetical protein